jgi:predicted nucleic acid-binding protein
MVPVVLTELLSDPMIPSRLAETLSEIPLIEIGPGYWQRAGALRAKVLAKRRKARLGDALIAQTCIDGGVPILTRDRDFRVFAEAAGLNLILGRINRHTARIWLLRFLQPGCAFGQLLRPLA